MGLWTSARLSGPLFTSTVGLSQKTREEARCDKDAAGTA